MFSKVSRITTGLAVGVFLVAALAGAQSKDPFVGSWKLNVEKSTYSPGPAPKGTTSVYEVAGKGYKISVKTEPASGPVQEWSYTSDFDGKDAPVSGAHPNADTISAKRIDAHTLELVNKKGGKITTTQKNVVAADGKTRTVTTMGNDATGRTVSSVAVFEKQ